MSNDSVIACHSKQSQSSIVDREGASHNLVVNLLAEFETVTRTERKFWDSRFFFTKAFSVQVFASVREVIAFSLIKEVGVSQKVRSN